MSSSNCCFLTCIQISQEVGQVVWYPHLFKNFPEFVVIHTVKGFGIVNKAQVDIFWNSLAFSLIQRMLAIWSLVPLPFSISRLNMWNFMVHVTLKPGLENFEHSLALPFFGTGIKTYIFQSSGLCWVFQIYWHIECSTFTASSFRIWKSSTGTPSPPPALFVVMFPKAHLASHPRMSGSQWVITPSVLSRSWRSFLYSSVYSCHLFLVSPAFVRSILFLYCVHICMRCSLVISTFLEETSRLSHSIVFLYFFALITEEAFLSLLAILWNSAFKWVSFLSTLWFSLLFFSQLFVRPTQTNILPFCTTFSWGGSWSLPPIKCHKPPSIVVQTLYQISSLESICHFCSIILRVLI